MRRTHPERAVLQRLEEQQVAPRGATVLVACSGGPDSVALASLLSRAASKNEWKVVLGHVNHQLRGSAWQDECVVLSVASALDLPLCIRALDSSAFPQARTEASLRERRYGALVELARGIAASVIVTAHTAEDQTETVLLALFRGTGLRGLSGIPPRRRLAAGVELVRPLLEISRPELHAELGASALAYARDPSNADRAYRRNAVRAALAGLREQFPHLDEAIARCARIVADELAGTQRALARQRLREAFSSALSENEAGLADVPFERIEAVLRARRGRVFLKPGVEVRVARRKT